MLDLQLGHLDEIQKKGNQYLHSDCFLKPQIIANYLPRDQMGLGMVHVRTKSLALFIKNLLEATPETNLYLSAVIDHYCRHQECEPIPVKPQFLTEKMMQYIKLVLEHCDRYETKVVYRLLLSEEFKLENDFKFKVEIENESLNLNSAVTFVTSKLLPLKVRNTIWKLFHNVIYDDLLKAKIKNSNPICQLCEEVDIDKKHVYFSCGKYKGVGREFIKVLQLYHQYTEADVLSLDLSCQESKLIWLVGHYLHFVVKKTENISVSSFRKYLLVEMEVLGRTKFCADDLKENLSIMVTHIGSLDD